MKDIVTGVSLRLFFLLSMGSIWMAACNESARDTAPLFRLMPSAETGVNFSNDIVQTDTFSILDYMYFFNGGGVGIGDINNDGLADMYLTGNLVTSRLYLNKGNFQFEDITDAAGVATQGWCTGVAIADLNNDGFVDIYVSRAGSQHPSGRANILFINKGNNTFVETAVPSGVADENYSTQAAFFDYDRDGDLDLYLVNHDHSPKVVNNPVPIRTHGEARNTDKLYRNTGNNAKGYPLFEDVSREAGILTEGYGLGVAISDLNDDGWPDIYVSNDFLSVDLLYINNRDGTFTNRIHEMIRHQSYNGMGVDVADYNNDGLPDIAVMDMLPEDNLRQKMMLGGMTNEKFDFLLDMGYAPQYMRNTLQLNQGNGRFSEVGQLAGIDKTDWSWSVLFADFNNDGWKDLFVSNGYLKDITDKDFINFSSNKTMFQEAEQANKTLLELMDKQPGVKLPNYLFRNRKDLTFSHETKWGMDEASFSNGAAFADLDNDGDLDLVVNNINDKAFIYRNGISHNDAVNYLQLVLRNDSMNTFALGAKVWVYTQGVQQFHEHNLFRGYQSTVDNTIHFGLGASGIADSVLIEWPDGALQKLVNVQANQRHTILRQATAQSPRAVGHAVALFSDITRETRINYVHAQNPYSDLTANPLLPQSYASVGPSLAIGDIDGNGLDDLYVGGTAGTTGAFFIQESSGSFTRSSLTLDSSFEDAGSLFFDADNDGDPDLYVASGGSGPESAASWQHRIYRNDGNGIFARDDNALPVLTTSGSVVVAADYDRDGDLDLFAGGRISPGNYPLPPRSYILRNDGGTFRDVTLEIGRDLVRPGLVTAALWTDFDNDGWIDLIVVGEWMPVCMFRNDRGKFVNVTEQANLAKTTGWWNSVAGGDMDNDGDTDYIVGNVGMNTPFNDNGLQRVSIYYGDLDDTGTHHAMLAWHKDGEVYPWLSKDILLKQMPRLGKRYLKYRDYAKATVDEVLSPRAKKSVSAIHAEVLLSSYLENNGNGSFTVRSLPVRAQLSPVCGMAVSDFDSDGNLDVLIIGNQYGADVSFGRYDAAIGLYLRGDGAGNFSAVNVNDSGFIMDGDARALAILEAHGQLIIGTTHADSLRVFSPHAGRTSAPASRPIRADAMDAFANMQLKNGKSRKVEFYYGSGYLSQSSRVVDITTATDAVNIVDFLGRSRPVKR